MRRSKKPLSERQIVKPSKIKVAAYGFIVLAIAVGGWIRWRVMDFDRDDKRNHSPDEAMYTAYASVAAHEGIKGTAISVGVYNKNEKLWILPPPTRIGYLYPLAGVMKLTGRSDVDIGLCVSVAVSVLSLIFIAVLCLRFFDPWTAFFASLFMAVSPMELAFARKVWQDGFMTLFGGTLFYFSFEILNRRKKYLWIAAFALFGAYAGLAKESGFVLLGLLSAGLMFLLLRDRRFKEATFLAVLVLAASLMAVLVLAKLSGGIEPLSQVYRHLQSALSSNRYALEFQDDPWYAFLEAFALLSPLVFILFVVGVVSVFLDPNRSSALFLSAFVFISFLIAVSIPAYFKNIRYLSPVFIPFYLLAATGLKRLIFLIREKTNRLTSVSFGALALIALVAIEGMNFQRIFIENHAKDLSNPLLRSASIFAFRK